MNEIGVWVVAAKILQRFAIDHGALWEAKTVMKNFDGIGARHGAHGVEGHAKATVSQASHGVEIK